MAGFQEVEHDPFSDPTLEPVEHDPFDARFGKWNSGVSPVADLIASVPRGILGGLAHAASAMGQASQIEMGQPVDVPSKEEARDLIERHVTGHLPEPQGRAGRFGETIGEISGNPANWVGPGGIAYKSAWNALSGAGSEGMGQVYEGTPYEPAARFVGSWSPMAAERLAPALLDKLPQGAAGVFGGRMAVTADHQALNRAESMAKSGASPDDIWRDTGWFQGTDKKWRFEINDFASRALAGRQPSIGEKLDHPDLFSAYPDLAKVPVHYDQNRSNAVYYEPGLDARSPERIGLPRTDRYRAPPDDPLNLEEARSLALHELQHAVQYREGFATGGNPEEMIPLVANEIGKNPALKDRAADLAYEAYMRLAGEVEARNVQARSRLSPTVARQSPPFKTADRPAAQQTIRGVKFKEVEHDPWEGVGKN